VYRTFCRPEIIDKFHVIGEAQTFSFVFPYFVAITRNVKLITMYSGLTHCIYFYSSSPYQKVRVGTYIISSWVERAQGYYQFFEDQN
jgi:hypothetical protein